MEEAFKNTFLLVNGYVHYFVFAVIIAELLLLLLYKRIKLRSDGKESLVSLISYIITGIPFITVIWALEFTVATWTYENARLFTLGNHWYVWLFAFLAFDLVWWIVHFISHKVRLLWCIHGVHHTPRTMNTSVAIRGSLFDFIPYFHLNIWLPLLGFHPFQVLAVNVISRAYGVMTHTNDRVLPHTPLLEKIFITPSLHRVHHSCNPIYIDTNFSNSFSIWDRLFGTFQSEVPEHKPKYGITSDEVDPKNVISSQFTLFKQLFRDIRNTPKWTDKFKYIVMPPDWTPTVSKDNSEVTIATSKAQ